MKQLYIPRSITNRSKSKAFDLYLKNVLTYDLITVEEEITLATKSRNGDRAATNKLILGNLRFVISVAKQYHGRGILLEDLVNEGNLGLIKAAQKFDPTRGFKFISYAVWWIRQAILSYICDNGYNIRLPLNKNSELNKINRIATLLEQELDRSPTPNEIAECLAYNMSPVQISKIIAHGHIRNVISLDMPIGEDLGSGTIADYIGKEDLVYDNTDIPYVISVLLNILSDRQKYIVTCYLGLNGNNPMTYREIGEELELTRERIRQIYTKSIRKLKHSAPRFNGLREYLSA